MLASAAAFCRQLGGNEYLSKLLRLVGQSGYCRSARQPSVRAHQQPHLRFIGLLTTYRNSRDELRSGPGSAGCTVVGRDRRSRVCELHSNTSGFECIGQRFAKGHDSDAEFIRTLRQVARFHPSEGGTARARGSARGTPAILQSPFCPIHQSAIPQSPGESDFCNHPFAISDPVHLPRRQPAPTCLTRLPNDRLPRA